MKNSWRAALILGITLVCLGWLSAKALAQGRVPAVSILHIFAGGSADGSGPAAGLIRDASGNLYGTTAGGGTSGNGTVFRLDPSGKLTVLYSFMGSSDGANPVAGLIRDASGNLYGTTQIGGGSTNCTNGCGTVFELVNSSGSYTEKVLYRFSGATSDGAGPVAAPVRDGLGNLYGTTASGGTSGNGTVFRLDPSGKLTVLYSFMGSSDGANPVAGLIRDASGNLYGTTEFGGGSTNCGSGCGTVFELVNSSGSYSEKVLYSFAGPSDGANPAAGLIRDASGNLYGTTQSGGSTNCTNGCGTVFELVNSSGSYTETVLYSFTGPPDGAGPVAGLIMDASGNLYGTTLDGPGTCVNSGQFVFCGTVFELIKSSGSYTETVVHTFADLNGCSPDGAAPVAGLIMDSSGNFYGTTNLGGNFGGGGTVFKLTFNKTPIATTTTLISSPNPATAGDGLTITASLTSGTGLLMPTGSVTFSAGATALGMQPVNCSQATLKIEDADTVGIGTVNITAQYTPDTGTFAASAGKLKQIVNEPGAALTSGSNTFSGNQTVIGTVTATSFVGNGSGLTGVVASSANTANFATTAGTADNALAFGGEAPSHFATTGANTFNGNQSVTGNILVAGNSTTSGSTTTGSVTIGGGTAIKVHLSVLVNPAFPALKSGACAKASFPLTGAADGDTIALGVPNERMTGGGTLIYTAWVGAANTVNVQACDIGAPQTTAGTGRIRIDLWKH